MEPNSEDNKPQSQQPDCPLCLRTGLVNRDGTQRKLGQPWMTWRELMEKFKPCPLCADGEREAAFWKKMEAEFSQPL